ncbi:MAG: hypothetical protein KAU21_08895 [Gammaproteobacteria bacterium]|nr:hypothetical protein [Gammaproteobacteria bacterium]
MPVSRLTSTPLNREGAEYVFSGQFGEHKTDQNNRAMEAALSADNIGTSYSSMGQL